MSKNEQQQQGEEGFTMLQWAESNPMQYDRADAYEQHIRPLVDQLQALCQEHRIPMHFIACFCQEASGSNRTHNAATLLSMEEAPAEVLIHTGDSTVSKRSVLNSLAVWEADQARIKRVREQLEATKH